MKTLDADTIGYRIRQARSEAHMTQKQFGEALDIAPNYVGLLERGKYHPSNNLLRRIALLTGKSHSWILTGELNDDEHEATQTSQRIQTGDTDGLNVGLLLLLSQMYCNRDNDDFVKLLHISKEEVEKLQRNRSCGIDQGMINGVNHLCGALDLQTIGEDMQTLFRYVQDLQNSRKIGLIRDFIGGNLRELGFEVAEKPCDQENIDFQLTDESSVWSFIYFHLDGQAQVTTDDVGQEISEVTRIIEAALHSLDKTGDKVCCVALDGYTAARLKSVCRQHAGEWNDSVAVLEIDLMQGSMIERYGKFI